MLVPTMPPLRRKTSLIQQNLFHLKLTGLSVRWNQSQNNQAQNHNLYARSEDGLDGAKLAGLIVGVLVLLAIVATCLIKFWFKSNQPQRKSRRGSPRRGHRTRSHHPRRHDAHFSRCYGPQYIMTASPNDPWARWAEARSYIERRKKQKHRHHRHTRKSRSGKPRADRHDRQRRRQQQDISIKHKHHFDKNGWMREERCRRRRRHHEHYAYPNEPSAHIFTREQWEAMGYPPPAPGAEDAVYKATPTTRPPYHEPSQAEASAYETTPVVVIGRQPAVSNENPSEQGENPFMTPEGANAAGIPPLAAAAKRAEETAATQLPISRVDKWVDELKESPLPNLVPSDSSVVVVEMHVKGDGPGDGNISCERQRQEEHDHDVLSATAWRTDAATCTTDTCRASNLSIPSASPSPPKTRKNTVKHSHASSSSSGARQPPLSTAYHSPIPMPPLTHLPYHDNQSHAQTFRPLTHSRLFPAPPAHHYSPRARLYAPPIPEEQEQLSSSPSCAAHCASHTRPPPSCRSRLQPCIPCGGGRKNACCAVGGRARARKEARDGRDGGFAHHGGESGCGWNAVSPGASCTSTELGEEKGRNTGLGGKKQRIVYRGGDIEEVVVL